MHVDCKNVRLKQTSLPHVQRLPRLSLLMFWWWFAMICPSIPGNVSISLSATFGLNNSFSFNTARAERRFVTVLFFLLTCWCRSLIFFLWSHMICSLEAMICCNSCLDGEAGFSSFCFLHGFSSLFCFSSSGVRLVGDFRRYYFL